MRSKLGISHVACVVGGLVVGLSLGLAFRTVIAETDRTLSEARPNSIVAAAMRGARADEMDRLIRENSAEINQQEFGVTPLLYMTLDRGHEFDIIKLLLQNGASPFTSCSAFSLYEGHSSLSIAALHGNTELLRLFAQYWPHPESQGERDEWARARRLLGVEYGDAAVAAVEWPQ